MDKAIKAAIENARHANEETCGLIIRASGGIEFHPCENIAINPFDNFEIDPIQADAIHSLGEIVYTVHSHHAINHIHHLSCFDRWAQFDNKDGDWLLIKPDLSYEIYEPIKNFRGRDFVDGVYDCLTIIRDFFNMCGCDIKDYQRVQGWWDNGENYYLDELPKAGFVQVDKVDLREGDVMLFNYASAVPNHAGIYIGSNQFLHHMTDRKSELRGIDKFWLKFCHSIWRKPELPSGVIEQTINRVRHY